MKRIHKLDPISSWLISIVIILSLFTIGVQVGMANCSCPKKFFSDKLILGVDQ